MTLLVNFQELAIIVYVACVSVLLKSQATVDQMIGRETPNLEASGSIPAHRSFLKFFLLLHSISNLRAY